MCHNIAICPSGKNRGFILRLKNIYKCPLRLNKISDYFYWHIAYPAILGRSWHYELFRSKSDNAPRRYLVNRHKCVNVQWINFFLCVLLSRCLSFFFFSWDHKIQNLWCHHKNHEICWKISITYDEFSQLIFSSVLNPRNQFHKVLQFLKSGKVKK